MGRPPQRAASPAGHPTPGSRVRSTRIRPYAVESPRPTRSGIDPAVVIAALVMVALAGAVVVGLVIT